MCRRRASGRNCGRRSGFATMRCIICCPASPITRYRWRTVVCGPRWAAIRPITGPIIAGFGRWSADSPSARGGALLLAPDQQALADQQEQEEGRKGGEPRRIGADIAQSEAEIV